MTQEKMQVEIWSDVMCPFCYIGKRRFEKALDQLNGKENIEVIWKSFQLNPDLETDPSKNVNQYLSEVKGMSMERAEQLNRQVTEMAAGEGLQYDLDKAIIANSMNAHRFSHFALSKNKQDEAEEQLFKAYFTEGKNTDDINILIQLGNSIGLDETELRIVLESDRFTEDVRMDIYESQQLGVRGVPFFVFNRKYAVSGAQETPVFLQNLEKSFGEWKQEHPAAGLQVQEGAVCKPDGECD
jgi:predicted DsbA family dithiol-disulfide isomerase